jgi:DNA-binding IclR family transcriptional regulator
MNVKTALRVIEIIETFARERRALSLSELARLLAVPASSCLALIRTLTSLGYLYETARRQGYYPTGRLLAMAQQIARHDPVLDRVHGTMSELRDATGETIVIGKLHEGQAVVYLDVLESPHAIRYIATAGERRELHANRSARPCWRRWTTPNARRCSRNCPSRRSPAHADHARRAGSGSAAGARTRRLREPERVDARRGGAGMAGAAVRRVLRDFDCGSGLPDRAAPGPLCANAARRLCGAGKT